MLERVSQERVTREWLRCLPAMEPALRRSAGQFDAATVLFGLISGDMQLWTDTSRVQPVSAVTGVSNYPGIRVLVIALISGREIEEWLKDAEDTFGAFALAQGCEALEACVRPGLIGATYRRQRAVLKRWSPQWTMVRLLLGPVEEN